MDDGLDITHAEQLERFGELYRDRKGIWREVATRREVRVWQRFLSGRRLDLLNPTPFDFESEDLALGLSREARWNGQTRGPYPYSVAQHSLDVLALVRSRRGGCPRDLALAALLHDASEGLGGAGDVISPLKVILGPGYRMVEQNLQRIAFAHYGLPEILPPEWKKIIKKADRIMAATEAYQLAAYTLDELRDPKVLDNPEKPRTDIALEPWPPEIARARFLEELSRLLPTQRR
ncbi:MAG TPA: hypothetical protein VGD08_15285 [Stellaceae bacterium]|jgi:hypothetical protein